MPEEEEISVLESAAAKFAVKIGRHLPKYVVDNLWRLVYTEDGQVILPEVHDWLKLHVQNPDSLTEEDIAQALEQAGGKYMDLGIIDELIGGIASRWLRAGINTTISWGKRVVRQFPHFAQEWQEKKDTIILTFLRSDASTVKYYKLLENKPKLTRFITEAIMTKLEMPLERPVAPVIPQPPGVG